MFSGFVSSSIFQGDIVHWNCCEVQGSCGNILLGYGFPKACSCVWNFACCLLALGSLFRVSASSVGTMWQAEECVCRICSLTLVNSLLSHHWLRVAPLAYIAIWKLGTDSARDMAMTVDSKLTLGSLGCATKNACKEKIIMYFQLF